MQGPWFSSGTPALSPPTQQPSLAPSEIWDDTYLAVFVTQQYNEAAYRHPSWSASGDGDGQCDFWGIKPNYVSVEQYDIRPVGDDISRVVPSLISSSALIPIDLKLEFQAAVRQVFLHLETGFLFFFSNPLTCTSGFSTPRSTNCTI